MSKMLTRFRFALVAVSIGGIAVLTSCAESRQPVGPEAPRADLVDGLGNGGGLLTCSPLPFDSVTEDIGPAGGVMQVGPHTFTVPEGALSQTVSITAVTPVGTTNVVRFKPDGLQFAKQAYLRMSYANCGLLVELLPRRIALVDGFQILDYLSSWDDITTATVTGRVKHFSDYAVAW